MKTKLHSLISLLLVLVMALALVVSCGGGKEGEDAPVTAEGIFSNYVTISGDGENTALKNVTNLSETLGQLVDSVGDFAVFEKIEKDRLNNLTETVSFYSLEKCEVVKSITLTYVDEYNGLDDFDHEIYPEKLITDKGIDGVKKGNTKIGSFFYVEYTEYTRIDDEKIEKDELDHSYSEKTYVEYYTTTGQYIAKCDVTDEVLFVDSSDEYVLASFGKTVAQFSTKDGSLVSTYDGDTNPTMVLYDHFNDKYNYMLNVPTGASHGDALLAFKRAAIEVYDKEGELVCFYPYGEAHTMHTAFVLQGGDVLIQKLTLTESLEYDVAMSGMNMKIDTFVLDVETATVTAYPDFKYYIQAIDYSEDINEGDTGLAATENVRNVFYASKYAEGAMVERTLFVDNFMNINFEFDGKLCYEMDGDYGIRVIDKDHILVQLSSGVAARAMLDGKGNLIAYIPDDAYVLSDYIVVGDKVYDLDMKSAGNDLYFGWKQQFDAEGGVTLKTCIGNAMVYECKKTNQETEEVTYSIYVVLANIRGGETTRYDDTIYVTTNKISTNLEPSLSEGYVIIKNDKGMYYFINGEGRTILSVKASGCDADYTEGAALVTFDTEDGKVTYLVKADELYDDRNNYEDDKFKDEYYGDEEGGEGYEEK